MRKSLTIIVAFGLAWGAAVAAARAAPAGPAGPLVAAAPAAPIERVVVYSDQARVYREARVALGAGATRAVLAALPPAARPDSVRVECPSAEITHVEVARTWERLPRQAEARALLARLEHARDELRALDDEQRLLQTELNVVESLRPVVQRPKPDKEPPLLFVDAWRRVLQWGEARATKLRARLAALPAQRHALAERLEALRVEGRRLLPDAGTGPALRVIVTLRGKPGSHGVSLSYVVGGVRWVPSYDLRYDPQNPAVEASYYALVNQASGEDWSRARLAFSTIMPSLLLAVPELPTWTLGRTTSFTPTPRERWEGRPSAWQAPPPTPPPDTTMVELEAAVGRAPADGDDGVRPARLTTTLRAAEKQARAGDEPEEERSLRRETATKEEADRTRPRRAPAADMPMPAPSMAPPPPAPRGRYRRPGGRVFATTTAMAGKSVAAPPPSETVPWTDAGYRPPYLDPDLPAASAKGHRFTMEAPGRHSVAANGTAVRVPLGRQRFGVTPVYRIVPGRSKAAYLTAEIFNSSGRPVLRGHANLFTGASYSGQTKLETAVPGGKLLLPLGVDEGVKVSRVINQRTVSTGVVFKDEVSEYTVAIEIANHRRHAIRVEVEDQVPVKANADARVEGFEATPAMVGPELDGKVTYKGTVGPGSVQKLVFKFRIVRHKNWELRQHGG